MTSFVLAISFWSPIRSLAQPLPDSEETLIIQSERSAMVVEEQPQLDGGHLQGFQIHEDNLFISGSSSQFAYLALFKKLKNKFRFLGIRKLAESPLNHAGGFQIADNWLAVGVEDPKKKKRSVVQIIDVSNAETFSAPPVYSLSRSGDHKRSTAGAVALINRDGHFLLAVGSWDCTTVDFYTTNSLDPYKENFEFTHWTTWDRRQSIRNNWVEGSYCSYQNLQLSEDSTGVYLTGFCRAKNGADKADVFRMHLDSDPYNLLQKVATYTVQSSGEISFRNGAGFTDFNGKKSIIAVGRNLSPKTQIQIFPIEDD